MADQLSLSLDAPTPRKTRRGCGTRHEGRTAPYQPHSTSRDAADRVAPTLSRSRRVVLHLIASHPEGATDNRIIQEAVMRGMSANGPRARRVELERFGWVEYAGFERDGSAVWQATPAGRFALARVLAETLT